jgi:epoxyqueuosine reductase QueG
MQQLAEEEQKGEVEAQQQLELERKFRMRIEAQQAYHDQMTARMKKLQQEAQEEAEYRQQVNIYGDSESISLCS